MSNMDRWTWIFAVTGMVALFSLPAILGLLLVGR